MSSKASWYQIPLKSPHRRMPQPGNWTPIDVEVVARCLSIAMSLTVCGWYTVPASDKWFHVVIWSAEATSTLLQNQDRVNIPGTWTWCFFLNIKADSTARVWRTVPCSEMVPWDVEVVFAESLSQGSVNKAGLRYEIAHFTSSLVQAKWGWSRVD